MTTNPAPRLAHNEVHTLPRSTRRLLLAGAVAGPLFYASALVQMLTRPGFDIRIHPLSQLSTGFIAAGLFPQDPANGFPLGVVDGPAVEPTWHALLHMVAAIVAFTALAVAAIVTLIRAIRERRAAVAFGNGIVAIALLAPVVPDIASIQVAVAGLFAFGWCTATAISLLRSPRASR